MVGFNTVLDPALLKIEHFPTIFGMTFVGIKFVAKTWLSALFV